MSEAGRWGGHLVPPGTLPGADLGEVLRDYHAWQARSWPRLQVALAKMAEIRTRRVQVGQRQVVVQWNPERRVNTTARVDEEAVARRPCFLCPANLPPEERGLAVGDGLIALANPGPIAPMHLVLAHREHRAQGLSPLLGGAVRVAAASGLTVFYNGPRCGASAPDHLHLQAAAAGSVPDERIVVERLARGEEPGEVLFHGEGFSAWLSRGSSRVVVVLRGTAAEVERGVRVVVEARAALDPTSLVEPPLNLLLTAHDGGLTGLLYLRGAHRPACYFAAEPERCLVSPGALDIAGLVVTVRRQDFERLDEPLLERIFAETSLDAERTGLLEAQLPRRLAHG